MSPLLTETHCDALLNVVSLKLGNVRALLAATFSGLSSLNRLHYSVDTITTNFLSVAFQQACGPFCNSIHVYRPQCGAGRAGRPLLLVVHISGYTCRTHHCMKWRAYQAESVASNLQFGPTKRRILSETEDATSQAVSDSHTAQRLGQHPGLGLGHGLPHSPTFLVGACHHTGMHWEQSCPGGSRVGWGSHQELRCVRRRSVCVG
jgi:hypothetical protein